MSSAAVIPENPTQAKAASAALPRAEQLFRFVVLTFGLLAPALICLAVAYVAEPDIWWHLSDGNWILQHHAFPRVDTFSTSTMGHPWQAYSWLFEVLVAKLYSAFGLVGIVAYSITMVLAITVALYRPISHRQQSLRVSVCLILLAGVAMLTLYSPRPWHFTILFFILELDIVSAARRSGSKRELMWLPVLFAFWANLHIQFVDGLLLLVLLFVDSFVAELFGKSSSPERTRVSMITAAVLLSTCIAATLLNPYGWNIYQVAHDLAAQTGVMNSIEELKAMPFRSTSNFLVLFLTFAAAAMLARGRRFPFFETALFLAATVLSFRSQRDIWIVVVVSVLILAEHIKLDHSIGQDRSTRPSLPLAIAAAACLLFGCTALLHISDTSLQQRLQAAMPVKAAAFVRNARISGPVFCDFIWGGYLMHALAMPVSVDGRAALHGDEQLNLSSRTWAGAPGWSSNPQLVSAGVVVAPVSAALTQLLRSDTRFRRVYEDKLAAVFVPSDRGAQHSSLH